MKLLILNAGSSSLKYKLLEMPAERVLARGRVERVGEKDGLARVAHDDRPEQETPCFSHREALGLVLAHLTGPGGVLGGLEDLDAVGHRVVHGGAWFREPVLINPGVLERLKELGELAPLHNPPAVACIEACGELAPGMAQAAYFDTCWYAGLPQHAYRYAVPWEWLTEHGVRRYGFHGISHEYVSNEAARLLGRPLAELRLITAHLGNGASITACDQGRAVDTSMGLTPLEGLMMGTRPGSLDPAVIAHLVERGGMTLGQVMDALNRRSGLLAVSGLGRDLRAILQARGEGHQRAALAFDMFVHQLRKYVGAYHFLLGGAHALVFTGGIGERSPEVRAALFDERPELGVEIDPQANADADGSRAVLISRESSRLKVLVIPTDEELMIARRVEETLSQPN